MFNLLLTDDKKVIYREYYLRLFSVVFLVIFCIMVAASVFLLPSYIWLRITETDVAQKNVTLPGVEQDKQLVATLTALKAKVDGLRTAESVSLRDMIEGVIAARGSGIRIEAMDYSVVDNKIVIRIAGVSSTRERLVAFSKTLGKDPLFSTVDVPVSNFVKDSNIEFSFDIHAQ